MYTCYLHKWNSHDTLCPQCISDTRTVNIPVLDGVAVVNINEPSPGDLERINNAYAEARERIKQLEEIIAEMKEALYKINCSDNVIFDKWVNAIELRDIAKESLESVNNKMEKLK